MKYYPILLNLRDVPVLVVGGGSVALRKIRGLRACGARVHVIATSIAPGIKSMAGVMWEKRAFRPSDVKGAQLVVAATSSKETNREVAECSHERGVFVNVVNERKLSSFILPAVVRRGDLLIAVSTQGEAPFVSAGIARRLRKEYGKIHAIWLRKMKQARKLILKRVESPARRRKLLRELLGPAYFRMIARGNLKDFERKVRELIDEAR